MLQYIIRLLFKSFFDKKPKHYYLGEEGYIDALIDLLDQPVKDNRNGKTHSMFGNTYRFDISDNKFPLLTTKHVSFRNILHELLWFLRGDTDATILNDKNVKIWNGNSTREFLDKSGLKNYKEGECGPIYGWQWRRFNANYPDGKNDKNGKDQVLYAINEIKKGSRRAVISAWNPCQLDEMALPPCHILYVFYVNDNELSCHMTMRSSDTFLGLPYNIASTALLTYIIGIITKKEPKEIVVSVADAHLYVEHIEAVKKQINNNITSPPLLHISKEYNEHDIEEWIKSLTDNNFILVDYKSRGVISAPMIA